MRAIFRELASRARSTLGDELVDGIWPDILDRYGPDGALGELLSRWAEADRKPLVLLIDEIDSLVGITLISVLRQLRAGYDLRPGHFPQSVVLLRRARTCATTACARSLTTRSSRAAAHSTSRPGRCVWATSPERTCRRCSRSTPRPTGQGFTPEALETVWTQTRGQPWLVNALADAAACFSRAIGRDRRHTITARDIEAAQEQLVASRETHLDQLADKLQEDRVRRVVEPLLSGGGEREFSARDIEYVRDLGLVAQDPPLRIANPIYAEVIPRRADLGRPRKGSWKTPPGTSTPAAGWTSSSCWPPFRRSSGSIRSTGSSDSTTGRAGPQLLLQAFLQRIVNGGGRIEREYGLGRGRTDLLLIWPQGDRVRRFVVECKVLHKGLERTIEEGLRQDRGVHGPGARRRPGHLVIFDRDEGRSWDEKVFCRRESGGGAEVLVWGM